MQTSFRRSLAVLAILTATASAQYSVTPAGGAFAPIAGVPGAVMLTTVSGCDDCTQPLVLTFPFPFLGANLTTLTVTSNGAILMGAFTDSLCCSNWALDYGSAGGAPVYFTPRPWIAVAQEDLNPGTAGDVWRLDTAVSTIVSWENVAFFGTTGASLNAQVELFVTGDIDIRFGTSNTVGNNISTGITQPGTPNVWFSPNSVLPLYNAVGQTAGGVVPQNTGVHFAPNLTPQWETNGATSSLAFNGVQATAFAKAATSTCISVPVSVVSLGTAGQGWEIGLNFSSTVSASTPGSLTTLGGQVVNLDLNGGLIFFFGGGAPVFLPHPGNFSASFPAPAGTLSAEQIVFDPTNVEGFSLSQACQLDATGLVLPPLPFAGPTFDDSSVTVPLGCVSFYNRGYSQIFIESNGRLIFGNTGNSGFTPSVTQFAADGPSFGVWNDLNPANIIGGLPGTIALNSTTPGVIDVTYTNVSYFGAPTIPNNFQLSLDTNNGVASIIGLTGFGVSAGQMLIGISGGTAVGATDPGAVNFSPGGLGTTGFTTNGTAMIYQMGTQGSVTTGINRIDFYPNGFGNYDWISG